MTGMTRLQTIHTEYVKGLSVGKMCSSLKLCCLPGRSANYNIKAVFTSDLFAFARCAITLNQERSAVDVGPMQNCFFLYCVHRFCNSISSLLPTVTKNFSDFALGWDFTHITVWDLKTGMHASMFDTSACLIT